MENRISKIEGIVLTKMPYKERDILSHILLRNGRQISVIIKGGAGGGKKNRVLLSEIGSLISAEIISPERDKEIYHVKGISLKWMHEKIRESYEAYILLSFFLEVTAKIAQVGNLDADDTDSDVQLFNVLSNAIFYLEESLKSRHFVLYRSLPIFIVKTLIALGIFPNLSTCITCGNNLGEHDYFEFIADEGGFGHRSDFYSSDSSYFNDQKRLYNFLRMVSETKFEKMGEIAPLTSHQTETLLLYLSHHTGKEFRVAKELFNTAVLP